MSTSKGTASKKASAKKVMAIMAFVAQGNSCTKAAQKFKVSPASVRAMVDGQTHQKITGMNAKEGRRGAKWVRDHKEMFIKELKGTTPKVSTTDKTPETPVTSTDSVVPTTRPAKPSTPVAMGIDLSDNVNAIKAEAAMVMSKLDTRKAELLAELKTIDEKRAEWEKFTTM